MTLKKIIIEVICFVLLLNFFYEGIYKIAYFQLFGYYIITAPLLEHVGIVLKYLIPLGEVLLAILLMIPKYRRKALYATIGVLLMFILWIMSAHYFTDRFFWPFHAPWKRSTWWQKLLTSMAFCWTAFIAINFLRNKPANAS